MARRGWEQKCREANAYSRWQRKQHAKWRTTTPTDHKGYRTLKEERSIILIHSLETVFKRCQIMSVLASMQRKGQLVIFTPSSLIGTDRLTLEVDGHLVDGGSIMLLAAGVQ